VEIRFSLNDADFICLLEHTVKGTAAHDCLVKAVRIDQLAQGSSSEKWNVICDVVATIKILELAHELCPQAVTDIRRGISEAASRS
jgi:hypothetical protein